MATIKINDINEMQAVGNQEAADVKGGPIYIKYGDIKGDVTESTSAKSLVMR